MAAKPISRISPGSGMAWGLLAGFVGTVAMDLALLAGLPAIGLPASTCYQAIGSTARQFFAQFHITLVGEVALGAAAYHIIGPLLGALYGLVVSQVSALQRASLKKSLIYAVLYAEVLSQLILTMMPLLLKMPAKETMMWFAGSFVLHCIWGVVMGLVMYYGWQLGRPRLEKNQQKSGGQLWIIRR